MQTIETKTVAEIAAGSLAAVKVFEKLGIDYCCGGKKPLAEACAAKGIDLLQVITALEIVDAVAGTDSRDWRTASLGNSPGTLRRRTMRT